MSRFLDTRFAELLPYTPGEQPQGQDMDEIIKLNTNESPFAPSPLVIKAINDREISLLRLYSDPDCKTFLNTLARYYDVTPKNVFAGNGSDEILAFIFMALCQNGVCFADITYGFYEVYAKLYQKDTDIVPLQKDFLIAIQNYAYIEKTVVIANPNAPTGVCLPLFCIEEFLNQNLNRLVVIDEAYIDFGGVSAIALTKKYDNLLVVGTFSKSRSLAGARLGFAVGNDKIIAALNTIKFSFNPYNINRLTLLAGTASIEDKEYFTECCNKIIDIRETFTKQLYDMGFSTTNSKANFVFSAPPPPHTAVELYDRLREKGILVRYFNRPRIDGYLRITIGTKKQMTRLAEVLQELI